MTAKSDADFLAEAVRLGVESVVSGGGPFGAVVVQDGEIVGQGMNRVTVKNDPTAHAEVTAIRDACRELGTFSLVGCDLYASCEPCPMCAAAAFWARVNRVVFAATHEDAARAGFDDTVLREEMHRPPADRRVPEIRIPLPDGVLDHLAPFREWDQWGGRTEY
jgi:guanine deaminase